LLILMTTAAAGVIYNEFEAATPAQLTWFGAGVGCAILGLAILTSTPQVSHHAEARAKRDCGR
jgi:hypothetical protein